MDGQHDPGAAAAEAKAAEAEAAEAEAVAAGMTAAAAGTTAADAMTAAEAMTATVVVPSALAGFAGGRARIPVELDASLDPPRLPLPELLDRLAVQAPSLERRIRNEQGGIRGHVNVYVDGVDIRELGGSGTVVVGGATVHIIAAVSGG